MGNARTGRGRADRTVADDLLRATWYLEARARVGCRYGEWWQPEVDSLLAALRGGSAGGDGADSDGADGDGSADGLTDPSVLVAHLGEARARGGFTDLETLGDVDALVTAVMPALAGAEAPRPAGSRWPDAQAVAESALSGWLSAAEPSPAESRAEALQRSLAADPGAALVVVDTTAPVRAGARVALLRCMRGCFPGATCHELVTGRRLAVMVPPGPGASRSVAGLRAALHMEPGLGDASLSVWVERVPAPAELPAFSRRLAGLPGHPEAPELPGHRHDRRRRSWHAGTSARGGRGRRAAAVFGRLDQLAGAAAVVLLLVLSVGSLRPLVPGEPFVPDAPAPAPRLPGGPTGSVPGEPAGGPRVEGAGGDPDAPAPVAAPTADEAPAVDLGAPLPVAHVVRPEAPTPAPNPPAAHLEPAAPPPDLDPAPPPPRDGGSAIDSPDPTAPEPGPGAEGRGRGKATGHDRAGTNRPNADGWGHPDLRPDGSPGPPAHAVGGRDGTATDRCGPGPRCHTPPVR